MDGLLSFENGRVVLGDKEIPGIIKDISIGCNVEFDNAKEDSRSGTTKTPVGWEDASITIKMILVTEKESGCYEKLSDLNTVFKGLDKNNDPKVFKVINSHLDARGVEAVVFKSLDSSENTSSDLIEASLKFTEYKPAVQDSENSIPGIKPLKKEKKETAGKETYTINLKAR